MTVAKALKRLAKLRSLRRDINEEPAS